MFGRQVIVLRFEGSNPSPSDMKEKDVDKIAWIVILIVCVFILTKVIQFLAVI